MLEVIFRWHIRCLFPNIQHNNTKFLTNIKKRGNRLSSVPLIEAFALPDTVEQTTLEAHADMIYSTTWSNSTYKHIGTILHWQWYNHTRGHLPLLSPWQYLKVAKFLSVVNKAPSMRLKYVVPLHPNRQLHKVLSSYKGSV